MAGLVAIVGRPNVGKSTLFNRLTRSGKAIVDETPGVTRDRNYGAARWNDQVFTVVDTGGFEPLSETDLSRQMREQTLLAVEEADVILFLVDAKSGFSHVDGDLYRRLTRSGKPVLVCGNKVDGPEHEPFLHDLYELGADRVLGISSAHGYGVSDMMDALVLLLDRRPAEEEGEAPEGRVVSMAVVGRPNVGKSSLINRILGEQRLLVTDVPGTTRDTVDSLVERKGARFLIKDTAGIRRKSRVSLRLEKYSAIKALKAMEESDVCLLMLDSKEGIAEQDVRIAGYAYERGTALVILLNKWDLLESSERDLNRFREDVENKLKYVAYAPVLPVSAKTGKGVERIFDTVPELYRQYTSRVPTPDFNRTIQEAVLRHSPPRYRNNAVRLLYGTQTGIRPPSFLLFANHPEGVHFSYRRFLVNRVRETFRLDHTPIRLVIKKKAEQPGRKRTKSTRARGKRVRKGKAG